MADFDLGTAHGQIRIDSDTTGINQAQTAMGGLQQTSMSTDQALSTTARTTGVAGAAIAAGLGLAVNTAMNFEQQLSAIKSVSGATAPEMDKIREAALRIGADTSFSASEAAAAMEELSKAGVSTSDILNGAADATVALAAASGTDLATSATIAATAMNQFNIDAAGMNNVVDLLAGAANASATDVVGMGEALSQVGPVAAALGLSFEDTAVAIAGLAGAGITGGKAGTALQAVLVGLQNQSGPAQEALRELGIVTEDGANQFFDASGQLKSMADVQQILQDSTAGLTDQQKQLALETIFGREALAAVNQMASDGSTEFNRLSEAMNSTTAADAAATRLDNFAGVLDAAKGSLETLAIQLGQVLIPFLRTLVESITPIINAFTELSPETQALIVKILAITAGALLFTAGMIKTVQAVQTTIGVLRTLRILSTATQPGLIATAGTWIASIGRMLGAAVTWVGQTIVHVATIIGRWVAMAAAAVWNAGVTAATWALNAAKTVASWVLMATQATIQAAKTSAAWLIANGPAAARAMASLALAVATTVGGWLVMAATSMAGAIATAAAWFVALGPIGWAIAALIALVAFVIIFWDDIKAAFAAAGAWIAAKLTELWNKVVEIWNNIISWFQGLPAKITNVFSGAATWLVNAGRNALQGLWNGVTSTWNGFWGWISGLGSQIINLFSGAGSWLLSAGGNLVRGLWNGISNMASWLWNKVSNWAGNIVDNVLGALGINSPSIHMIMAGEYMAEGLSVGIDKNAQEAINSARDMALGVMAPVSMLPGGSDSFWDTSGVGQGSIPASPEVSSYAASQGAGGSGANITTNIYNPAAEKASDSEARRLRTLGSMGAFGG